MKECAYFAGHPVRTEFAEAERRRNAAQERHNIHMLYSAAFQKEMEKDWDVNYLSISLASSFHEHVIYVLVYLKSK